MIDWIDAMARSWGYQLRKIEREDVSIPSLAGRVMDLGAVGAAIRSPVQVYGESLMGDALEFHCAYQRLDKAQDKEILAIHYVVDKPVKVKHHKLGIKRSTYWQRLDYAQRRIAELMGYGQRPYGHIDFCVVSRPENTE